MEKIRAGGGLGDSLYLRAIVEYLLKEGMKDLTVATNYSDIFKQLPVQTVPFTRQGITIVAHYSMRRHHTDTNQFEDMCLQAGLPKDIPYETKWKVENKELIHSLRKHKKPVLLVQMPRNPMDRADGFGREILPDCQRLQHAINLLREKYLIVQIGAKEPLFKFENIDVNLANKTSVSDILDLAKSCEAMLGYCSFFIPLAEIFNKKAFFVWSRRNLNSMNSVVKTITPKKIIHKKELLWWTIDDEDIELFDEKIKKYFQL